MRTHTLLLVVVALLAHRTEAETPIVGTARVIDGDTIEIHGVQIRLHGIDTPKAARSAP
jgi:endonuclease YncB( thermonuclease family)